MPLELTSEHSFTLTVIVFMSLSIDETGFESEHAAIRMTVSVRINFIFFPFLFDFLNIENPLSSSMGF